MKQKNIIILRGASGSGKSSVAELFGGNAIICCADDYFMDINDHYNFDPNQLGRAHHDCQQKFLRALDAPFVDTVVVANTNAKISDFQFYIDVAENRSHTVFSLVVEKRHNGKNQHNVPEHVIDRHEQNIKNTLKLR
jgi:predicted kinase